jgi:hypothetical protein
LCLDIGSRIALKLVATIPRSLRVDLQAELRDIERAVASGTRDAGRGLKAELVLTNDLDGLVYG